MLWDGRLANEAENPPKFKLPNWKQVLTATSTKQARWWGVIDISNGFFHVPVAGEALGFTAFGRSYVWNRLPQGWNKSPFYFQKLAKAFLAPLRAQGHKLVNYIDDILYWGDSLEEATRSHHAIIEHLERGGWIVNAEKTPDGPTRTVDWIGFHWNDVDRRLTVSDENTSKCLIAVKDLLSMRLPYKSWEKAIGMLNFVATIYKDGQSRNRNLLRHLAKFHPRARLRPTKWARRELLWWQRKLTRQVGANFDKLPSWNVTVDASPAKMETMTPNGEIRRTALPGYIMFGELQSALWGIATAPPLHCVKLRIDNQAGLCALRKGSSSSRIANEMVKLAWFMLSKKGCQLEVTYVRSEDNPADFGSRSDFTTPTRRAYMRAKDFEPTSSSDAQRREGKLLLVDFPNADWKLRRHKVVTRYPEEFKTHQGCWDVVTVVI